MKPFAAPVADILFSLNHVADASRVPDYDADIATALAEHFASFAEGVIAPISAPGDVEGAKLVDGRVHLPEGYNTAYRAFAEQGWTALTAPEAYGGQGLDAMTGAIISEIETGASQAFNMLVNLPPVRFARSWRLAVTTSVRASFRRWLRGAGWARCA
ncbi:MAG: acyl-CoA dehydrogenase family protein [Maritimibacter sp.]